MIGKWGHILLGLIVSCAIVSCGGHSDRASLVALDSLILQDPDSACELLATYPADSLTNADDRAYHALLTTIADYKAYRPATTDSVINIAVNHYDHDAANPDHRMRSLLYKGCVMEELGNLKEAMRCYKEAQYACPDNDNFHKGYIFYKIACLFQSVSEAELAEVYYQKAILNFLKINEKYYSLNCVVSIGEILRISKRDTALKYINDGLKLAIKQNDNYHIFASYSNLAGYYFYYNQYNTALKYSLLAIRNSDITLGKKEVYYFACESYLEIGHLDSAQIIFNQMPSPQTTTDSIIYCRCLSDLYKFKGDTTKSYILSEEADMYQCKANISADNGLVKIEAECDRAVVQRKFIKGVIVVSIVVVSLLLISSIYYFRNKHLRKQTDSLLSEVSQLNKQINGLFLKINLLKKDQTNIEDKYKEKGAEVNLVNNEVLAKIVHQIDLTIECYSSLLKKLLNTYEVSSGNKNKKIRELLSDEFFVQLHQYVNLRFNGLVYKLNDHFQLTQEEINIVCLDLCKFPTSIIWVYSDCDKIHSVYNKKKIIAKKVNNCDSIAQIPETIN